MFAVYDEITKTLGEYSNQILFRRPLDRLQVKNIYNAIDFAVYLIVRLNLLEFFAQSKMKLTSVTELKKFSKFLDARLDGLQKINKYTDYFIYTILCLIRHIKRPCTNAMIIGLFKNVNVDDLNNLVNKVLKVSEEKYYDFIKNECP
jgi:hypothetical protein